MKVFRIHISSWTASFRYPNMISGFQPTLPVPPVSTVIGIISSAMGKPFVPSLEKIGFVFQAKSKTVDLETIYQMGRSLTQIKSNVIKREFLFDANLFLYTDREEINSAFEKPYFPLLLGRSGDLATIEARDELEIKGKDLLLNLKGTVIPFDKYQIPAMIQALPVYFTDTIPRRNVGTQPYYLLEPNYRQNNPIAALGFEDKDKNWDVYWQEY
ncbi:MAG: type I-B CRISPR-associated protein Cas5 [Candidatus Marinimicrobia bacterium CG08_land_8_20_14_0_20_45_22]|nr:MAG: type I-B CRISPR-associated protein Cas5 [Candidatus Marinimicrobia bacterium CG08_land_8_20_14_0_20_45_22]